MNQYLVKILFACAAILPAAAVTPGQPIETRAPEKADDKPAFPGQTRAPYQPTAAFQTVTLTDQLNKPWSLAFLPDGGILIAEKPGTLRILDKDRKLSQPLTGVPKVQAAGQVGLLDLALDAKFSSNHRLFLSYAEPVGDGKFAIAMARATLQNNALADVTVIFRAKPALSTGMSSNSGGRIAIGRDGNLFMTIGDRSKSPPWLVAQQLDTHLGKVIHITPDGEACARQSLSSARQARCRRSGPSAIAARKAWRSIPTASCGRSSMVRAAATSST